MVYNILIAQRLTTFKYHAL